jgi:hypothetical protein
LSGLDCCGRARHVAPARRDNLGNNRDGNLFGRDRAEGAFNLASRSALTPSPVSACFSASAFLWLPTKAM